MIKLIDLGILANKTLIIADLHIGYEEALNKQGVLVPRLQFNKLKNRLTKLLKQTNPETVIINGDIKHEFGTISEQEWRETLKIIDLITENSKLIIIKGNHDKVIGPIANKRNVEIVDHYITDDIYICHGNKLVDIKQNTIIIAHLHPAITLKDEAKSEKYKCFLKANYQDKTLYVLPSFLQTTEGTDITREAINDPFLKDLKEVEVIIPMEDKLYNFGKISLNHQ
ncbi:metallophosphoesterase [Candidatus Woesearchaeota archaeon]|jgi:uncharacterized protein|nr:metallophosphoesterase [Candidatus Woesearchaeota archaeon]MBT4368448.1 metallophosphoesterase [Candidatus Woesearchaeota archaeon]MBT4712937.1 metallophosphoesterase [Candidatus Woesearchaeota archaeon]MBT6639849.1 metallophosphoesterase [Candidatus Woesearchaeota archaeon]MBT7134021.1 metallophosphoesterase [Candidatus Woesearchaeota archaeon]